MSNQIVLKSDQKRGIKSYSSVTKSSLKTHCIICNSVFNKPRAGKLYCSNRCKQFGYNHKQEETKSDLVEIHRKKEIRIHIKDYSYYVQMNTKIKRFKELSKRNEKFKDEERKLNIKKNLGIPLNLEYSLSSILQELDNDETDELEIIRNEICEFKNYDVHNLSLEQWSFFKMQYRKLCKSSA